MAFAELLKEGKSYEEIARIMGAAKIEADACLSHQYVFVLKCPLKSPCLPKDDAWFAKQKSTILTNVDTVYQQVSSEQEEPPRYPFSEKAKSSMYDRMVGEYKRVARSGELEMKIKQGCCENPECPLSQYQRWIVQELRRRAREEIPSQQ